MNSLTEVLQGYLSGQLGLSDLTSALEAARRELRSHREDVSTMIAGIPDFLVASERDPWLNSYTELSRRLVEVEEDVRERARVEALAGDVASLLHDLTVHSLALRESAWAARGPSSHAGVNELLHLMERWLADPDDENLELLRARIESEFHRLEMQSQLLDDLPEFAAVAMEELLPEYRTLLETATRLEDLDEEETDELFVRLETWGQNFGAYDVDFISKRYSGVPTALPSVNLVLNSQLVFLEGLVAPELVDYVLDKAVATLQTASDRFLQETDALSEADRLRYQDILTRLLSALEAVPEVEDAELLKRRGDELLELTSRFVEIQTGSEPGSGSRLDYKSE